jgi:hypothetical protein
MKVKDTLTIDLVRASLREKAREFAPAALWEKPASNANISYIKQTYPNWQYNGVDSFQNVMLWCEEHLGNNWIWNMETIYFKTEQHKLLFLLRWS